MTELPPTPDTHDDAGVGPAADRPPARPRWVKVSLIIVLALVVAFVILQLAGVGSDHGPGRHIGPASTPTVTDHRPPAGVPNHGD